MGNMITSISTMYLLKYTCIISKIVLRRMYHELRYIIIMKQQFIRRSNMARVTTRAPKDSVRLCDI